VLARLPRVADNNVLVGFDTSDDAGVYKLSPECALVQTVDFFTPIVDDPYTFGAIAAANALSDVYAMGGRPVSALSVLAYPGAGDLDDLDAILRGGMEKMREAGCALIGGHSVNDPEIKFGYAVTGVVHPDRVLTNAAARPGDALVFTKRLGTGVISTALKRGLAQAEHVEASIASMLELNRSACAMALAFGAHAVTDVTGFGLIGHAREMALASGVTIEIDARSVQFLPGALEYARLGALPGGLGNNRDFASCAVEVSGDLPSGIESLLYDPQTSGGLLIAASEAEAAAMARNYETACLVGRVIEREEKPVRVVWRDEDQSPSSLP
jgi:selenide, water dikinase